MKVIAKTSNGFLIEATETEIVNTMGYYSTSASQCPRVEVGLNIRISEAFSRLNKISYNSKNLRAAKAELKKIQETLTAMEIAFIEENVADKVD